MRFLLCAVACVACTSCAETDRAWAARANSGPEKPSKPTLAPICYEMMWQYKNAPGVLELILKEAEVTTEAELVTYCARLQLAYDAQPGNPPSAPPRAPTITPIPSPTPQWYVVTYTGQAVAGPFLLLTGCTPLAAQMSRQYVGVSSVCQLR
jgi:hypothetical protein